MILINFASRARPQKFHSCMENLRECFTDYRVNVKIDRDDPTIREYLSTHYPESMIWIGHSDSKIHAINRDVPDGWDILVNTSDDILWKPGAGDEIRKQMEPDTFLHFPEPYADSLADKRGSETFSVVSIMDRVYYDRFCYVYNTAYFSLCCDNEATEVSRMIGRYKFVNKYIFSHEPQKDHLRRHTQSFYSKDKETLINRRSLNFAL